MRSRPGRLLMRVELHHWMLNALCGMLMCLTVRGAQGEARCYCNEPSCVSTSYMCKSQLGVCFSQLLQAGASTALLRTRHACAEMLPEVDRRTCVGLADSSVSGFEVQSSRSAKEFEPGQQWTDLICCTTDMCNYKNKLGVNIYTNRKRNNISHESSLDSSESDSGRRADHGAYERQLWFRASIIAVPLVGAFILLVLAFTAARIVTRDRRQPRDHYSDHVIKVQLPSATCRCVEMLAVARDGCGKDRMCNGRCCCHCCSCSRCCSCLCNTSRDFDMLMAT